MNIEHRTSNVERRMKNKYQFSHAKAWLDPPEADKCLLACGELDVHLLTEFRVQRAVFVIYNLCRR